MRILSIKKQNDKNNRDKSYDDTTIINTPPLNYSSDPRKRKIISFLSQKRALIAISDQHATEKLIEKIGSKKGINKRIKKN